MLLRGQNVLQISLPRAGSNAVARMLGQSPDIAAVLRSWLLEYGPEGLLMAAGQAAREAPGRLVYIKEHAAFLGGDEFGWFDPADRFLLVVRDPVQQLASAVAAIAGNRQLLRKKLARRQGRPVTEAELTRVLDAYAGRSGLDWDGLAERARRAHDPAPLAPLLADLFRDQPERRACESDVEWFDHSLFQVVARSWTSAVDLARRLRELGAQRVAVVDFTMLRARPELITEVCQRLEIQPDQRMVSGPWRPAGRWFDAGLELADGHRWVERARHSTMLEPPQSMRYDPLRLPAPARRVLWPSLGSYLTLLAHPGLVGAGREEEVRSLVAAGSPVTAWSLAHERTGPDSDLTRSVEQAHPWLRRFFAAARQHPAVTGQPWHQLASTTPS